MITRVWKVYGAEGHRQKESFNESYKYDFSEENDARIIEVQNSDITGTNEYSIVKITRNTSEECQAELDGQISDGIFENSRVGKIEEIEGVHMKKDELYTKICERAEQMGYKGERLSLMMDIESADKVFNLRLEEWLNADGANFAHDINGIINNIVRDSFPATDFVFFVPRFAGPKGV